MLPPPPIKVKGAARRSEQPRPRRTHMQVAETSRSTSVHGRAPVEKGFRLLSLMADRPDVEHGVRDLAGSLGYPVATVHRLLASFSRLDLVTRSEVGRYQVGPEFLRIAW